MNDLKQRIIRFIKGLVSWRMLLALVLGAIAGYAYYRFVGCSSGSCAITSNPYNTVIYGMLMGGLLGYREKKDKVSG